ncbi:MAG: hypothetical protein QM831_38720 [Kofleriaceae bacterium]
MRWLLALALLANACVTDHHDLDQPIIQPRTCVEDVSLDGATSATATVLGPYTIDRNGLTVCLHLDATKNLNAAHLMVENDIAAASTLQDEGYSTLQESWDVGSFENLEWNAPLHLDTDAMLWIHARGPTTRSSISISFQEPFE